MITTTIREWKLKKMNEAKFIHRPKDHKAEERNIDGELPFHVDEPTSDDAIREDGLMPYKSTLNTEWIEMKLAAHQPFFIMGHAGWGKTSVIKRVAKAHGLTVITVYLDKALPEDLGGIPTLKTSSKTNTSFTTNALPPWAQYIYDRPDTDFLLFFDEMNQAKQDVQNALMPIILEYTIANIKFDNIWIGAAGNYAEENASVVELIDPLRSRFIKEGIWNEEWDEAFEHIGAKYTEDKIDQTLLKTLMHNNICFNPREFERMVDAIIKFKNTNKQYSSTAVFNYFSDFNKMEKNAETKKVCEAIYEYLNTSDEDKAKKEEAKNKKTKVSRSTLSDAKINALAAAYKNKTLFEKGQFIKFENDEAFLKHFDLTAEELQLVKSRVK